MNNWATSLFGVSLEVLYGSLFSIGIEYLGSFYVFGELDLSLYWGFVSMGKIILI